MQLSARNQLPGTVVDTKEDAIIGVKVTVVVKATKLLLAVGD